VQADDPRHSHDHTIFQLVPRTDESAQELRFRDQRKFGRVYLVADPGEVLANLGPEPLDDGFSPADFEAGLGGRKRVIKTLLLDQSFLAGLGNIYTDEALFYAGVRPTRKSDTLSPEERAALYAAIRQVLNTGIEREGASIDLYLKPDGSKGDMQNAVAVYGRTELPCLRCGTPIERISLNGRGTHYCPNCQK
jgi:formamidopyrimidine-DNA glycosylase